MIRIITHIRASSMLRALFSVLALVSLLSGVVCTNALAGKDGPEGPPLPVTFNDGWRWAYRTRVVEMLKDDLYEAGTLRDDVFRAEVGLGAKGGQETAREAEVLFAALVGNGQESKAAVLEALITFFDGGAARSLEDALRLYPDTGYTPLGWYLLGEHYERRGFYPEAAGYFNRLRNEAPESAARTAGLFHLARIRYLKGEYEAAKPLFKEAVKAGSGEAPLWLANTLLIKGEFSSAKAIYDMARIDAAGAGPLTLLSMGDMAAISGDYDRARSIFESLRTRFANDQFLEAFFELKKGDAYEAEGRRAEALEIYRRTKENLNLKEGWAMASLSIADVYAVAGSGDDLRTAYDLYSTVAAGGYIGSEEAHLSMARTALKAGMFVEALAEAKGFPAGYPSSRMKDEMDSLVGDLIVRWMGSLYSAHDYYGVVKLYIEYGPSVPFGKKASTYLMAGKAYAALGLDSDSVNALDSAVKIARREVAEEAMVTLAAVYISQRDWSSAERLVEAFKARFPESAFRADADRVLLNAAFIGKDYKKTVLTPVRADDGEGLMIQAAASVKLGRLTGALKLYSMALKAMDMDAGGGNGAVVEAYTGLGDANFTLGRYTEAVGAYRMVLENAGVEKKRERAWALYRMAQSFGSLGDEGDKRAALDELEGMKGEISGWADMIFTQEARM